TAVADHQSSAAAAQATGSSSFKATEGLRFNRVFSKAGVSPYDEVQWERRDASISDFTGKPIFFQKDVEVPVDWSVTATNIVASKYLHGPMEAAQTSEGERSGYLRENSVRQLVGRVAETIRDWGIKDS